MGIGLEGECEEFKGALLNPSQELSILFASLVVEVKYTYTKYWNFHKLNAAVERTGT